MFCEAPPLIVGCLGVATQGTARNDNLSLGQEVSGSLAADATAEYFADLEAGHFVYAEVDPEPKLPDSYSGTFTIGGVTFQRDDEGNLTGLYVSNIRSRNIGFERQDDPD